MIDVKVCGITDQENATALAKLPVQYLGLIFVPSSPRAVTIESAKEVCAGVSDVSWVGVFVDESIEAIAEATKELPLSAIQLHGDEDESYIRTLRENVSPDVRLWKVVHIADETLPVLPKGADAYLFDSQVGEQRGGTGVKFNWEILSGLPAETNFLLSGGISPDDASGVRAELPKGCIGLDINSRFELSPGLKDVSRVEKFLMELNG